MNKVKKIIIGTVVSLGIVGGLASYATAYHGGMRNCHKSEFLAKHLNFNEVQKQNLENLKTTIAAEKKAHHENHPREKIMELLSEPKLDQEKALAILNERFTAIQTSAPKVIAAMATFTDSLADDQRAKLKGMIERFGKHRGMPFGN
jgi:Spy/CpxP family protein refolding chaperone